MTAFLNLSDPKSTRFRCAQNQTSHGKFGASLRATSLFKDWHHDDEQGVTMHSQRCITARANTARLPEGAAAQDVRPLCCIQLYDDIRLLAARAAAVRSASHAYAGKAHGEVCHREHVFPWCYHVHTCSNSQDRLGERSHKGVHVCSLSPHMSRECAPGAARAPAVSWGAPGPSSGPASPQLPARLCGCHCPWPGPRARRACAAAGAASTTAAEPRAAALQLRRTLRPGFGLAGLRHLHTAPNGVQHDPACCQSLIRAGAFGCQCLSGQ